MSRKKEIVRVRSILENDRMNISDNFLELLSGDLSELLRDYFDFKGEPLVSIEKFGDRHKVEISILASRLKNFECVPK